MRFLLLILAIGWLPGLAQAGTDCRPVEERPIKIEAWMSKKRLPEFRQMRREFGRMGNTYVSIFSYPGENPSRIVAIGRCVPAYIARHALQKSLDYYGQVKSLVHPGFIAPHWIGLASSLFAESSQRPISKEQLNRLLNPSLGTDEFHALYREFTSQPKTVQAFGQTLPYPKLMK